MAPNPVLQQLITHVESSHSTDTLQVIFNWASARLQDQVRRPLPVSEASMLLRASRPTWPSR